MALCLLPPPQLDSFMHRDAPESPDSKTYSFVALPGNQVKKRPRRRYDEIERLYHCSYPDCNKAYGTLNHLNAHVSMQRHGPKRSPNGSYFISFVLRVFSFIHPQNSRSSENSGARPRRMQRLNISYPSTALIHLHPTILRLWATWVSATSA